MRVPYAGGGVRVQEFKAGAEANRQILDRGLRKSGLQSSCASLLPVSSLSLVRTPGALNLKSYL